MNAGKYLDLICNDKKENLIGAKLTEKGKKIFKLSIKERQVEFIKSILSHKVFNLILKKYFDSGDALSINEIVDIMKVSNLYNINKDKTFKRRASTILSWINWIIKQIEE